MVYLTLVQISACDTFSLQDCIFMAHKWFNCETASPLDGAGQMGTSEKLLKGHTVPEYIPVCNEVMIRHHMFRFLLV